MRNGFSEKARRDWLRKLSSRGGASVAALTVFLLLLAGGWLLERQQAESVRAAELAKMLREISVLRARVESALNAKLYLVQSLNALVHAEPEINEAIFQHFAEELGTNIRSIRSLQLAPQGVVRFVWPIASNRAAIGHDLFADPRRRQAAELAIAARSIWLAGPLTLIQGGTALIGRLPIFSPAGNQEGTFWGFATILLDVDELIAEVGLDRFADSHQVAVRGRDALGDAGDVFFGDAKLFEKDVVSSAIQLPAGSWEVASMPLQGWATTWPNKNLYRLLWLLAAAVVAGFIFWLVRLPHSLRLAVDKAVAALSVSESRFRDAIEALPDGFAIYDASGKLVVLNEQLRRQFAAVSQHLGIGNSYEELLRKGVELGQYRFNSEREAEEFVDRQLQRRAKGVSFTERQLADGRWIFVTESEMSDGGLVAFYRDITELKVKELQLTEEKMSAESANRAKSDFLATVSHELRTPLNAILGLLDLLADDVDLSEEQRSFIETASNSAKHLLEILNEILDISKMEAGKLELEEQGFVLADTLDGVVKVMRANAEHKGLVLRAEIDPLLSRQLRGDSGRLRQVVLNLLGNAIKFSDRGEITLRARCIQEHDNNMAIVIEVSDQGIGFDSEHAETLFEPFAQLDSSAAQRHSGTGLGLAICRRIVEKMGGEISARSEPGVGSCFAVKLVLLKEEGTEAQMAEDTLSSLKLLLVEPSPAGRAVCEAMLSGYGCALDSVCDVAEMTSALSLRHYDVLMFDCPSAALGDTIVGVAAAQPKPPQTLALCAQRGAVPAGVGDWLQKPVDKQRLFQKLSRCAESRLQLQS